MQKTIKAKIIGLTKIKEQLLSREYNNWQMLIKSLYTNNPNCIDFYKEVGLHSATKQQALRFCRKLKLKNQPMIIRRDTFNIQKHDTKLSNYWAKIPIYKHSIKVAMQFPYNQEHLLMESVRQAKLIRKKNKWFLHITIQKALELKKSYSSILAMDLGEKMIATSVVSGTNRIAFYGRNIRGIRRHYAWLRKRLQERKLRKVVKRVGQTEKRKVNDQLYKIARHIVDEATQTDSVIVHGDLKGIRKESKNKGRRMRRIVASMPYYKLTQMITYMANWDGRQVIKIDERETSHTCSRCGSKGYRPKQGIFNCKYCGLKDFNADLNGAKNIAKRFSGQCLENGAVLAQPKPNQALGISLLQGGRGCQK